MTRRSVLALAGGLLAYPRLRGQTPLPNRAKRIGTLRLRGRTRVETQPGQVEVKENVLLWNGGETAIIVCDMWDDHYCVSAARRVGEMVPRLNQVLRAAREQGVVVIHAPSGTMDFYKDTPQRRRIQQAPYAKPPVPIAGWCHLDPKAEAPLPIDDQAEPCDDAEVREPKRYFSRQHPGIEIGAFDGISDDGQEIYNFCEQEGISNLVMAGVHANMCVLGRPFGIRQQVRLGKNIVLVRDLTDAMYDPRDKPYVSHERGTEMVVEHIERYWCPSVHSSDLVQAISKTQSEAFASEVELAEK